MTVYCTYSARPDTGTHDISSVADSRGRVREGDFLREGRTNEPTEKWLTEKPLADAHVSHVVQFLVYD